MRARSGAPPEQIARPQEAETPRAAIDQLIINSPYEEPACHWHYDRGRRAFSLAAGRRRAGYFVASRASRSHDDPGRFVPIPLVNKIRPRVSVWRAAGYPGVTGTTKRLLEYWNDPEEHDARRFFFCQLEAAETLIWLTEAPAAERVGVEIPSDGGAFPRLCAKMATGSGKTVVMAMVIAWHILNKAANPKDARFSRDVLIVAPGLTVKNRLAVLSPQNPENYYQAFRVVPSALFDRLRRGRVVIRNWHALAWESAEQVAKRKSVDKRGARSDAAYVRDVLGGDMARARRILVINDEAHHAWRVPAGSKVSKAEREEATKWVGGLDRIHRALGGLNRTGRARGLLACYDFSATPFAPSGKKNSEEALFEWIVSDFGLNDAIESGLVKTPRVVVRDDAPPDRKTDKSSLYHIYDQVKDDLNRKGAKPEAPLPDLVMNAYYLLGADWRETARKWEEGRPGGAPPVMITVANRTETAARVKHAFDRRAVGVPELCDPERTLHIDSSVLKKAEAAEEPLAGGEGGGGAHKPTQKEQAELLRQQVDTVGQSGKPGGRIQKVISVGMLSEGWDAKTVTHIMGLRAFSSQLLCEQVVGRGLRRTSYDLNPETGRLEPEYVNIFGVPFSFLPHEGGENGNVPPPPKTPIEAVAEKAEFAISWPNVVRVDHAWRPRLSLDWERVEPLELDAGATRQIAQLAPTIDGNPDLTRIETIRLEALAREHRTQRIIFETARDVFDLMRADWRGRREFLLAQVVRIVEGFIRSDKIRVAPALFAGDGLRRRLVITLSMRRVVQHIWEAIRFGNTKTLEPVFDRDRPIRSTGDMGRWHTGRPCTATARSHINYCVHDSAWEASEAYHLDRAPEVAAWAKNDHLGFEVFYVHGGVVRKYRPDFLVRLRSGGMLVLETKGLEREPDKTKRRFLDEWVRAVNAHGGFGRWSSAVSRSVSDIHDILARHARETA